MKRIMSVIIAVGLVIIVFGCGGSSSSDNPDTTPTEIGSVTPANNSILTDTQAISLTFNESMDPSTLVLGGAMGAASDGGVWSTTSNENDTLTISPATTWSAGTQILTVAVNDMEGNAFPAASVAKDAASGSFAYGIQTVYVRSGGTGDGTWASPMGDINVAITQAASNLGDGTWATTAHVEVAQGTYNVTSGVSHVQMMESVSLYGGYSDSDWTLRDPSTNTTTIQDASSSGGDDTDPNRAFEAGAGITSATMMDGFNVLGGGGDFAAVVYIHDGASPTISNNTIVGGSPVDFNLGVMIIGASPTISNNSVNGGTPTDGSATSVGIYSDANSSSTIFNNTVSGGSSDESIGVGTQGDDKIFNNTINGGIGTNASIGVFIDGSNANIENNIIFTSVAANGWGMGEDGANDNPQSIRNNDIFNCPTGLYHDADGGGDLTTIAAMEADLQAEGVTTGGNVSVDPVLIDLTGGEWHLGASSPTEVTQGGLDGSAEGWGFSTDKDGNPRTAPWSMGAYEYD